MHYVRCANLSELIDSMAVPKHFEKLQGYGEKSIPPVIVVSSFEI